MIYDIGSTSERITKGNEAAKSMGFFDDIEVELGVDLPDPPSTRQFQTKSLEGIFLRYRITIDGRLVEERRDDLGVTDHDVRHHGELSFYTSEGDRGDGTWRWHEYIARFTNGKLDRITKVLDRDLYEWQRRKRRNSEPDGKGQGSN